MPKTFAQIVAEGSYTAARVARQAAADLKKEAIATKVREEKERRERRKKEKESSKENLTEKSLERENDSDDDIASVIIVYDDDNQFPPKHSLVTAVGTLSCAFSIFVPCLACYRGSLA